ncbi:Transmembrane protein-like protein [Hapsidospora chrysogenum ATCC 11550]|uniref:Transmembrane protein-like protein n=1 Tax=Hapsidospora chrysogenum (strain ATCC 11550 / CBS 779.69 / DSM 880 / IAM 14645 / JCM 23072 / IMI 49137) TaxID=857340 RepID=A0A086T7A1_HAPC1|nr:Transmembrane protein-like protein [Hapsidospora chrysogenum ATCC 11550]
MKPLIAVPATCALIYRAWSKKSLTPAGLVAATLTAIAHAYHPWNLPFVLLCVFFLAGTRVTHIKQNVKTKLTVSSKGTPGGEGPRNHVQVLANSLVASILAVLHANQLYARRARLADPQQPTPEGTLCYSWGGDLLIVGIIANYAAVAADTFSSELGILSKGQPRLITSLTLRKVPPGTNGGVTIVGLAAGLLGSMIMVTVAVLFLPMCDENTTGQPAGGVPWLMTERRTFMGALVIWGALGSVLDSVLGGLFQRTVKDMRSGKVVEGDGGQRALVPEGQREDAASAGKASAAGKKGSVDGDRYNPRDKHRRPSFGDSRPSRVVECGRDLLDNNDVNFLMAVMMSVGAMAGASWYWGIPVENLLKP